MSKSLIMSLAAKKKMRLKKEGEDQEYDQFIKAFIEGIEAGDGWCDYMEVDQTDIENVTFDDI